MLRVVIDPGVLIAGLIAPSGAPAEVLRRWRLAQVQLVVSPALLGEFMTVCGRDRFRRWFSYAEASAVADLLEAWGEARADDPATLPPPEDPADAYLVDLTATASAHFLITGDSSLLRYRHHLVRPCSPRTLLATLDEIGRAHPD